MAWRYNLDTFAAYPIWPSAPGGYGPAPASWEYTQQPQTGADYAASPVSTGFVAPPPPPVAERPTQDLTTGGPIYQTFLNSFTLSELNASNKPFLARLTPFLPLELAPHSRPPVPPVLPSSARSRSRERRSVGSGAGVKEAEKLREAQLRWNVTRDPRFDWELFPRTVGWRVRGERELDKDTGVERLNEEQDLDLGNEPDVEIDIDFRINDTDHTAASSAEPRKRPRPSRTSDSGADSAGSGTDDSSRRRRLTRTEREAILARARAAVIQPAPAPATEPAPPPADMESLREKLRRSMARRTKKKNVTWPGELENRETAPIIPTRYGYYYQYYERYRADFMKQEQEVKDERKREDEVREYIAKMEERGHVISYEQARSSYDEAKSLEAPPPPPSAATTNRSKYNPRSDPSYTTPTTATATDQSYISAWYLPAPKAGGKTIVPSVPKHREKQPVKSSLFRRASRRVTDAAIAVGARAVDVARSFASGVYGAVRGVGAGGSGVGERAVPPVPVPVQAAPSPPPSPPPPPVEEEDDKSDTERFYHAPPPLVEESDNDDDAFSRMLGHSAGTALVEQKKVARDKGKGRAVVVAVHSTRDLYAPSGIESVPVDPVPSLPEIGTGASRPVTRDNTAFNAAGLDFIPLDDIEDDDKAPLIAPTLPALRPVAPLPATASRKQREVAEANERYRRREALYSAELHAAKQRALDQYFASLSSLAPSGQRDLSQADSWRNDESDTDDERDDEDTEEDEDGCGSDEERRRPRKRVRGAMERGRSMHRKSDPPKAQDDGPSRPRLHSPPPEQRLPDMNDIDDEDKEDFRPWEERLRENLQQYNKRYEIPEYDTEDDYEEENPDFADITLDDDLEISVDQIEVPEIAAAPLYGSGFNRDRVMPKIRRPDRDREREQERTRREQRRFREGDERRGGRWASGVPGRRSYGW